MKHIELEKELNAHIRKRRIVEAVLGVVFLIIGVTFHVLREESRVVEIIGEGIFTYQYVTYNNDFLWGIVVGIMGFIPSVLFLFADLLCSKVVTFQINRDILTFYRGFIHEAICEWGGKRRYCLRLLF